MSRLELFDTSQVVSMRLRSGVGLVALVAMLATQACEKAESGAACADGLAAERTKDYAKARTALANCLESGPGHIDTHKAYQRILQVEQGPRGTKEAYAALVALEPHAMRRYAAALLEARPDRIKALEAIVDAVPDFGPAHHELSNARSSRQVETQSLFDRVKEREHLRQFLKTSGNGNLKRWFVDYEVASAVFDEARERSGRLGKLDPKVVANPITLNASPSGGAWTFQFMVAEPARDLAARVKQKGETFEKAHYNAITRDVGRTPIQLEVRYTDSGGRVRGPYVIDFDPIAMLKSYGQSAIQRFPAGWVAFTSHQVARTGLQFTRLVSNRCGLNKVEYGLDVPVPDRTFELSECNPDAPHSVRGIGGKREKLSVQVPLTTKYATVRLTFADGTRSIVSKIPNRTTPRLPDPDAGSQIPRSKHLGIITPNSDSTIEVDGKLVGSGVKAFERTGDGPVEVVVTLRNGLRLSKTVQPDQMIVRFDRPKPTPKSVDFSVRCLGPPGTKVGVDPGIIGGDEKSGWTVKGAKAGEQLKVICVRPGLAPIVKLISPFEGMPPVLLGASGNKAGKATAASGPKGTIIIKAKPWAKCYIDGVLAGVTPVKLKVAPGEHAVRCAKSSRVIDRKVKVRAGRRVSLKLDFL